MRRRLLAIGRGLLGRPTAPFREEPVREYIRRFCAARGIPVRQDAMGNLFAVYGAGYVDTHLAFSAHMDHPGFIISADSRGHNAAALFYGGVDDEYFRGSRVRVFTARGDVCGRVLGVRQDKRRRVRQVKLRVEGRVWRGDAAMWDLAAFRLARGRIHSRACDDTVGCVAVLGLLDELARRRVRARVRAVFTVAEEGGMHGVKYLCLRRGLPARTVMIGIETSMALPTARMGDGVVIRVGDLRSVFTPEVTAFMTDAAKRLAARRPGFRYQRRLMDGGTCESTVYYAFGYATGGVCIPLGNYHNRNFARRRIGAEYVSVDDLENMCRLFVEMVTDAGRLPEFLHGRRPRYAEERRSLGERLLWERG